MAKTENSFEPGRNGAGKRPGRAGDDRKRTPGGYKGEKKVFNRNDRYSKPEGRDNRSSDRDDTRRPGTEGRSSYGKPAFAKGDRKFSDKPASGRYSRSEGARDTDNRRSYGKDREGGEDRKDRSYGSRNAEGKSFGKKPYSSRGEGNKGFGRSNDSQRGEDRGYGKRSFGNDRPERAGRPERAERKFASERPGASGAEGGKRTFRPEGEDRKPFRKPFGKRDERRDERREGAEGEQRPQRRLNPLLGRRAEGSPAEAPSYNYKPYKARKDRSEDDGTIRLNRYIANAGICSRREADSLIEAGEIKVNGMVITEMGYKVKPSDTVQYGKKILNRQKMVYVLLNKPKDFITTTEDPEGRKTVMDLVTNATKERIFPVGRLDRNTTGLLLFTNDGELAQKLTHPSFKHTKIYQVELDKPITNADFEKVAAGVELEDGKADVDDVAILSADKKILGLEIHIGRNRIVRRIFEHLGYEVVALDRVKYASLDKKDLPRGSWRYLTEKEVIRLKHFM